MAWRTVVCGAVVLAAVCSNLNSARSEVPNAPPPSTVSDLRHLSLEQLGSIEVVTQNKEPTEVWRTPAAVCVITHDQLKSSGATNIAEALRLAPGVDVSRIDSDHWAIGIRGFGNQFSKSVLVLIDGRSVYTPLFEGVYWAIQDMMMEDIDRIEVIRGPGATIWGSNAVNGVINIITRSSFETGGFYATVSGGSVDQGIGSVRVGSAGSNAAYRLYAKGFSRGPEFHRNGVNFDDWRAAQGGFRADWNLGRNTISLHGDGYRSLQGWQVSNATFTPPGTQVIDSNLDFRGTNLVATWRRTLKHDSDMTVQMYWDYTHQDGPQAVEDRNTFDLDLIHRFKFQKRNSVTWGVSVRESPSTFKQVEISHDFDPRSKRSSIYSGFLQDESRISNRLQLTFGSKFEDNNYTGLEIEPTVRVLWTPTEHQSVWGAVTRAVRTPARLDEDFSLYLLALRTPLVYAHVVGNHKLSPENLIGYEAGYRMLAGSRVYFDLAGYYNRYNDLIGLGNTKVAAATSPVPTHLQGTLPWTNTGYGHSDGFEISPQVQALRSWRLTGSYSYLHLSLATKAGFTDHSTTNNYQGSSPQHVASVLSAFSLPHAIELDQTYRYASALPYQKVHAYHTLDARFAWRLKDLTLSVVGQNLLQPHHAEFGSDTGTMTGIRRAVYGELEWSMGR
jgi:iron complex outermembrane receptor protein